MNFISSLEARAKGPLQAITDSDGFVAFIKNNHLDVSNGDHIEAVRQYLNNYLFTISNNLESMRDQALRSSLIKHGADVQPTEKARAALQRLSHENIKRIFSERNIPTSIEVSDPRLDHVIEDLQLDFHHYGNNRQENVSIPLLSAQQMNELGLAKWALNTQAFNREIGSDNNLFFFPMFSKKTQPLVVTSNAYGSEMLVPEHNYSMKNGWISFFVMYPIELAISTKYTSPNLFKEIDLDVFNSYKFGEAGLPDYAVHAREKLYRLDFTPEDFEAMVKHILKFRMAIFKERYPQLYENFLSQLEAGVNYKHLIAKLVYDYILGMTDEKPSYGRSFEAKIPVVVPREKIRGIRNSKFDLLQKYSPN